MGMIKVHMVMRKRCDYGYCDCPRGCRDKGVKKRVLRQPIINIAAVSVSTLPGNKWRMTDTMDKATSFLNFTLQTGDTLFTSISSGAPASLITSFWFRDSHK